MAKTNKTKLLEAILFSDMFLKKGYRGALEVNIPVRGYGRCDYVGVNKNNEFICVEIKISLTDFKSKNGHNFVGHKNYYMMTQELYEKTKDSIPKGVGVMVGSIYKSRYYREPQIKVVVVKPAKSKQLMINTAQQKRLRDNIVTASNSNIRLLLHNYVIKEFSEELKGGN